MPCFKWWAGRLQGSAIWRARWTSGVDSAALGGWVCRGADGVCFMTGYQGPPIEQQHLSFRRSNKPAQHVGMPLLAITGPENSMPRRWRVLPPAMRLQHRQQHDAGTVSGIVSVDPMPPIVANFAQVVAPSRQGAQGPTKLHPAAAHAGGCGSTTQRLEGCSGNVFRQGGRPMATSQVRTAPQASVGCTRSAAGPERGLPSMRGQDAPAASDPAIVRALPFRRRQRRHLAGDESTPAQPAFSWFRRCRVQPCPL